MFALQSKATGVEVTSSFFNRRHCAQIKFNICRNSIITMFMVVPGMDSKAKRRTLPNTTSKPPVKKPRGDPENLVPARKIQCAGDRTESALASSKGEDTSVSASTRSLGDLIAKPWGVETPEIVPELPGKDAAPSHVEVLKLVKGVAANVVTTLPTFFKNHKKEFGGLGFEVQGDMHPSHYDALALPTSVVVLV